LKMQKDETFYIQISDSAAVRKALLENSKQVIQLLKRFEQFKLIRAKKMEELLKLRKTNKEVDVLLTKMKKLLPNANMRVKLSREKKAPVPAAPVPKGELEKLESELRDIESKIGGLQ